VLAIVDLERRHPPIPAPAQMPPIVPH
jgi:hypothetical protein